MTAWYDYPISVPFNNPNFDKGYGGSHDLDVATPPNTEVTSIVNGHIVGITSPSWGKCVSIQFASPYNGIPYFTYLHLAAVNPNLDIGMVVSFDSLIGWSGGCNTASQYGGTGNPTGLNFLNTPEQSSQPQTGIALMRGPEYGIGAGWTQYPDSALDPTPIFIQARKMHIPITPNTYMIAAAAKVWSAVIPGLPNDTEIYASWEADYYKGVFHGPALTEEMPYRNWNGVSGTIQFVASGQYENIGGKVTYYDYH